MQKMQVFIYCKITLHVSGVYRTHHQECIKLLLQLLVRAISRIRATTFGQRGIIRPCWQKVVALIRDMTRTRSCSYSFMHS